MRELETMRLGICPNCNHDEIIIANTKEFGDQSTEYQMAVTYEPRWIISGANPRHGRGALHMLVCRSCGYVKWFTSQPETIPIGDKYGTGIIKGEKS